MDTKLHQLDTAVSKIETKLSQSLGFMHFSFKAHNVPKEEIQTVVHDHHILHAPLPKLFDVGPNGTQVHMSSGSEPGSPQIKPKWGSARLEPSACEHRLETLQIAAVELRPVLFEHFARIWGKVDMLFVVGQVMAHGLYAVVSQAVLSSTTLVLAR